MGTMAVMDETMIIDYARHAIWITLKIGAPIMMIGLLVGVMIGLLQALTQIQEMTLTFVPKIIAIFLGMFAMLPYMNAELTAFMRILADQIIGISVN